jgi:hypothetical protein
MLHRIIAVILGMIACQAVFSVLALATMQVWPNYASHAHHYLDQRIFTFTSIMACMNLVFWALGFIAAGWMTVRIARDSSAIWALAGLMELYAVYAHVVRSWSTFPWWYNIVVVCSVVPAVLVGKLVGNEPHGASARRSGLAT